MSTRNAFVRGVFYPQTCEEIEHYIAHFNAAIKEPLPSVTPRALIVPHAGYIYSGYTANLAYVCASKHAYERIVVIGPSHRVFIEGASIAVYETYETPCGALDIDVSFSELLREKGIDRETFHGGMEQDERERALLKFRNDSARILITTDLASRGLDVPEVESIVHYQLPPKEDAFIHRNGRTARMNAKGFAYLIMTEDENFPFIKNNTPKENVSESNRVPGKTPFQTVYISAGKKDKVNKVDIVGYLIKKGELEKGDIGLIEVKDTTSYVAVDRKKVKDLLKKLANEKLKGKKVKMEVAY